MPAGSSSSPWVSHRRTGCSTTAKPSGPPREHPGVAADDEVEPAVAVEVDGGQRQARTGRRARPSASEASSNARPPVLRSSRVGPSPKRSPATARSASPSRSTSRAATDRPGRLGQQRRRRHPGAAVVAVDGGGPGGDLAVGPRVAHDHQVEVAVAVEVGERRAAGAGLLARERRVDGEPVGPAAQQPVGGGPVGAALAVVLGRTVGEAADEQVGPAVAVDVGRGDGVAVHAGERVDEARPRRSRRRRRRPSHRRAPRPAHPGRVAVAPGATVVAVVVVVRGVAVRRRQDRRRRRLRTRPAAARTAATATSVTVRPERVTAGR